MPSVPPIRRRPIRTVRQLVKSLGGWRRVAAELSVGKSTVYDWINANEVPRPYEVPLVLLAKRSGVLWVPRALTDLVMALETAPEKKAAALPIVANESYWPARLRA
jgi:DNA invertase Pin-like site-specific DNA recombinase